MEIMEESGFLEMFSDPDVMDRLPERIHVILEPICSTNLLPVTVTHTRFTGTQRQLTLATPDGLELQAWVPPSQNFAIGQAVFAHLPTDALWSFSHGPLATTPVPQALSP
ncbi:MAG: TOBE domain-containing protein, partial [Cyanobacteria bacterium P01_D01_bin.2]